MSSAALALVLIAAFTHASWNYALKRTGGGIPLLWVTGLMSFTFYIPAILIYCWWRHPVMPDVSLFLFLGSGLIKIAYTMLLQRGYRHGDFSLIYPLARGTGPLFSTLAAILIFGERPSVLALAGGALIIGSVFYLTGGPSLWHSDRAHLRQGLLYGFACGLCIAAYTVWDQRAVSHQHVPPIIYDCGTGLVMNIVLTIFVWPRRQEALETWRAHRGKIVLIGLFGPLGYVLILTAMTFTPVSYIAPAREISILIGTFFGAKLLKEAEGSRRLLAAGGMVAGIIALALG